MQIPRRREETDMLSGAPAGQILRFSFPLVAGNLFAQLYSLTDAAIVGNFVGVDAFAAVGCCGWLTWLLIALCRDCSNAVCILASVQVGAKNYRGFQQVFRLSVLVGGVLSAAVCAPLLLSLDTVLAALHVPQNIYASAGQYLQIYTLSFPLIMLYSMENALLRARGNSRLPFWAMTVSTLSNVGLDLGFVVGLKAGVAGAAWATLIAQGIAVLVLLVCRRPWAPSPGRDEENARLDPVLLRKFLALWLPMLLSSGVIAVGGLYVQSRINALGSGFTAGISAGEKIFSFLEAIVMAVQAGVSVFIGQNLGGGCVRRIRRGFLQILWRAEAFTAVMAACVWLFGGGAISLLLSRADPQAYASAFETAQNYIRTISLGMLLMTPMYFFRAAIQTLGHAGFPAAAGVLQLGARLFSVRTLPRYCGRYAYYLPDVLAWLVSLPVVAAPYVYYLRRLMRGADAVSDRAASLRK